MKVKVIKKFKDRQNKLKTKEVGEIIEITKERYKELITSPYGVFVEEIVEEEPVKNDEVKEENVKNEVVKDEVKKKKK